MIYSKISKSELKNFYQSKFDYYRKVAGYCAVAIGVLEILYFFTDCMLYQRFAYETLIPRLSILIPLIFFIIMAPRVKSYRQGVLLYYLIPHAAMWSTIWSIYHLENRDFAREGFIIMHFAFLAIGLAMPVTYHIPIHAALIASILLSNQFNHYRHVDLMVTLAIPLLIGVVFMLIIVENTYGDASLVRKELEENSKTDSLTGLYNRFIFNEITNTLTNKFSKSNLYIMMLDIDFFKKVNDTYGHESGDEILKFVALHIKSQLYKTDYAIRWGGEEFVVLLYNYNKDQAMKLSEKLRNDIKTIDNYICPITISIGLYKYNKSETYTEAIDKADKALYYAKGHGRDMVVDYSDIEK